MSMDRREQALQSVEAELRQERAGALGRTGRKLEELIARLDALLQETGQAPATDRFAARQAFRELREQADYQLWCYLVQREAVGIIGHREVYETYRIPSWPADWA